MQILRDRHLKENDDPFHLLNGRVHEAEGRDRAGFALFQAVRLPGPIVWIVLAHDRDRPMPGALPRGVAERLHLIAGPQRDGSALGRRGVPPCPPGRTGHRRTGEADLVDGGPAASTGI